MRSSKPSIRLMRPETLLLGLVTASLAASLFAAVPARAADDEDDESGDWADRIGNSVKNTMEGFGKRVGLGNKKEGPPPKEAPSGCPTIAILDGTASSRVSAANASGNQGVRYQFSLASVGRQCTVSGGRVSMRVAAGGRVLIGPAGTPGRFDVPLRVVVFSEAQQKPVVSKLYKVGSSLAAGQASTPFQFVSDTITVPTSGNAAAEYSVKVGLDSGKGGGDAAPRKGRRRAPKVAETQ